MQTDRIKFVRLNDYPLIPNSDEEKLHRMVSAVVPELLTEYYDRQVTSSNMLLFLSKLEMLLRDLDQTAFTLTPSSSSTIYITKPKPADPMSFRIHRGTLVLPYRVEAS